MKIFVKNFNPQQGPIEGLYLEVKVVFYDDVNSPHHEADVIVFLEKENL
ncbi:MAG: hypothetical protein HZA08_04980 [Nitrospirae bacterium]|nr:hypothetical protein [Nitrospirota bacterium]